MLHAFSVRHGQPDLARELDQFRNEVNRLFANTVERYENGARTLAGGFPVNVYAADDELVVTAELPGVSPDAVDVSIEENLLTIRFERPREEAKEGTAYHRRERAHGKFARSLELPIRVDADRVEARADNGVLQVRLPRLEADKPRKITIKTNA